MSADADDPTTAAKVLESRASFAELLVACPVDRVIDLQLFDGPTRIHAMPKGERVLITVSDALGLHISMTHELARRLAVHLAWAGTEAAFIAAEAKEAAAGTPPDGGAP